MITLILILLNTMALIGLRYGGMLSLYAVPAVLIDISTLIILKVKIANGLFTDLLSYKTKMIAAVLAVLVTVFSCSLIYQQYFSPEYKQACQELANMNNSSYENSTEYLPTTMSRNEILSFVYDYKLGTSINAANILPLLSHMSEDDKEEAYQKVRTEALNTKEKSAQLDKDILVYNIEVACILVLSLMTSVLYWFQNVRLFCQRRKYNYLISTLETRRI